jgi:hypothetical protein
MFVKPISNTAATEASAVGKKTWLMNMVIGVASG